LTSNIIQYYIVEQRRAKARRRVTALLKCGNVFFAQMPFVSYTTAAGRFANPFDTRTHTHTHTNTQYHFWRRCRVRQRARSTHRICCGGGGGRGYYNKWETTISKLLFLAAVPSFRRRSGSPRRRRRLRRLRCKATGNGITARRRRRRTRSATRTQRDDISILLLLLYCYYNMRYASTESVYDIIL